MSTRFNFKPYVVIDAEAMSGSLTSTPTILDSCSRFSYSIIWSGGSTPVGTVSIQGSNDYALNPDGTVKNAGTWTTMTFSLAGAPVASAPISGNSGSGIIDVWETSVYAVRLIYTRASGNGTMTAIIKAGVL